MVLDPEGTDWLNCYALVSYVRDSLGAFVDRLRKELVPVCNLHAHVTILPPRPLAHPAEKAAERVRRVVAEWPPFSVEVTGVGVFEATSVIYLVIGGGEAELRELHDRLNSGELAFEELYRYQPHITLAQEIPPERLAEVTELARRRWAQFTGSRAFLASSVTLVQSTRCDGWIDLAEFRFAGALNRKS